jgi:hypothetical protein
VPKKPAIFFPAGRYLISDTIQLYANISLYGEPRDIGYSFGFTHSSEIIAGSAMGAMVDITGSNIYIGYLSFYGNSVATYGLYTAGAFGRASGNTFEYLALSLFSITGIYINNMGLTKMSHIQVSNCTQCGMDFSGFGDADFESLYVNTINPDSTSTVDGPSSATVYGVGIRFRADTATSAFCGNLNIRGGKIEFCRIGILMSAAQGINITGINFDTFRKAAIYIDSDSFTAGSGQTTLDTGTCTSIQITGNRFLGGSTNVSQTPSAHIFAAQCRYITISGNGFKRADDAAADFHASVGAQGPIYGVWLYNAELCTVVGNDLYGAATTNCLRVESADRPNAQLAIYNNSYDGTELVNDGTIATQPTYGTTWARFTTVATPVITSSNNVLSVTKVTTNQYQVNFINAYANNAYTTIVSANQGSPTFGAHANGSIIVNATDGGEATVMILSL